MMKQLILMQILKILTKLKSYKYKTKLTGSTAAANATLENVTIAVPLKYLSNFRRSSEMP